MNSQIPHVQQPRSARKARNRTRRTLPPLALPALKLSRASSRAPCSLPWLSIPVEGCGTEQRKRATRRGGHFNVGLSSHLNPNLRTRRSEVRIYEDMWFRKTPRLAPFRAVDPLPRLTLPPNLSCVAHYMALFRSLLVASQFCVRRSAWNGP